MNDAGVAPPGVMPIQQPISVLRKAVSQYCGSCFQVCQTTRGLMRACTPLNASPSSMVSRISPMPNRPITAIRKSKPRSSSWVPKVMRRVPVTVSSPTAASAKPSIIAAMVFAGWPLPRPTKLQKVSNCTAKNSGGPNRNENFATSGARNVITITAISAPTNEDVNAAVRASPARPALAIGWPSKVVATDHGSPGILNRMDVMAPPNSAPQ